MDEEDRSLDENLRPLLSLMGQNFSGVTELSKNQVQQRCYPLRMHLHGDCGAKNFYLPCINNGTKQGKKSSRLLHLYFTTKGMNCVRLCWDGCVCVCECVYDSFALIFLLNHMVQSLCVTSLAFGKMKFMHYLHSLCFFLLLLQLLLLLFRLFFSSGDVGFSWDSNAQCVRVCVDAFDVHDIQ